MLVSPEVVIDVRTEFVDVRTELVEPKMELVDVRMEFVVDGRMESAVDVQIELVLDVQMELADVQVVVVNYIVAVLVSMKLVDDGLNYHLWAHKHINIKLKNPPLLINSFFRRLMMLITLLSLGRWEQMLSFLA
jgi:hypothetical protein